MSSLSNRRNTGTKGAEQNDGYEKNMKTSENTKALWFSPNPNRRWSEIFFLKWSVVWILVFSTIVATEIYKTFGDIEFLSLGLFVATPYFLIPYFFPADIDKKVPLLDRYWVKANVWIAIFGYVGNYFWTHYFYKVLGATYDFPVKWELNQVPICLYLVTHAYFCFYHVLTTMALRRFWTSDLYLNSPRATQLVLSILLVFSLSYFTAFMEAFTISSVPYYVIQDRTKMYLIGSAFYGIYFYVSFPMFYRLDEDPTKKWTLSQATIDSLAAAMTVTIFLDLWRLVLGSLIPGSYEGLPWLPDIVSAIATEGNCN